ncbi:speckle-type POZ protein A [Trichonephila clavata]|uniref:Speckle-type POZ protein A n=1 Tax=Trichonephila clavata TaxID=2740835 RepID=A0A8X6JYL0_TRICU|nr:speckle-type POZ protein A [Trichonephila clavata]
MGDIQSLKDLSKDLLHLFTAASASFADVVLKCESFTVPVHKNILAARSPVFSAMFKNDMRESQEKTVDISDIGFSVLRIMLVYIYTGNTEDVNMSNAVDILFAADKYQLMRLKKVCAEYLKSNASGQNILNLLVLGDLHDQDLKDFAVNFICHKVAEFSVLENTGEWKRLQMEKPSLAMEILISLVKARDKKVKDLTYFKISDPTRTSQLFKSGEGFKFGEENKFGERNKSGEGTKTSVKSEPCIFGKH